MASEMANTVGWYILEGYPWWPVYICDQFKLRTNLHQLGDGHKKILKKAKDFPKDYALVYYFGSYSFSLVKLNKGILKPWDCSEKDQYLSGHPKHLMKKGTTADDLQVAIREVEDYLSQPEDMRLPPFMVPSDLDPTLEAPPPMERPEEEEDDGDEDMENDDDADGGDDHDDADGDEDMDHEDGDKKSKKTKKTTKKATKKEKTEKEKKPKKEKKEKEKKPPKEKKEKKTPSKDKEKKSDTKKKSDDAGKEKPAKLKRQRSSTGDDANGAETSKTKQHKKEKAVDVKTGDDENLAETLEREIRWILSNEQYEEMTTKMLRNVLEERLKRDLKQHRETIKAVVTRVIEEEEDAAAATGGDATTHESEKGDGDVKMAEEEEPVKNEPKVEPTETTNGAAPEEPEKKDEEPAPVKEEVKTEEVKKEEEKVEDVKEEVKVEPPAVPSPKPVNEADILAIKDKLVDSETTHEELLASLDELHQMPLDLSHLKHTGIARVVANLRQHANDKVSIAAKELRNAWMQLAEKGKPSTLKKLEKMNETLESDGASDATKLSVFQKLEKLSVTTQEIIDAKIGVTISKLRKSSQAEVAEAANKLRQKWKKLAAASSTAS